MGVVFVRLNAVLGDQHRQIWRQVLITVELMPRFSFFYSEKAIRIPCTFPDALLLKYEAKTVIPKTSQWDGIAKSAIPQRNKYLQASWIVFRSTFFFSRTSWSNQPICKSRQGDYPSQACSSDFRSRTPVSSNSLTISFGVWPQWVLVAKHFVLASISCRFQPFLWRMICWCFQPLGYEQPALIHLFFPVTSSIEGAENSLWLQSGHTCAAKFRRDKSRSPLWIWKTSGNGHVELQQGHKQRPLSVADESRVVIM